MKIINQVDEARQFLKQGKIIVYPTEAVYGLGCDPFNQQAVDRLLAVKQRSIEKGFIILIADWSQLFPLISSVSAVHLDAVRATWPGPVTWVFPKATAIPEWMTGHHHSIAIRMSAHPIAQQLCIDGPVISTSANVSGQAAAVDIAGVCTQFPHGIDAFLAGNLGGASQPSAIFDVLSGIRLR